MAALERRAQAALPQEAFWQQSNNLRKVKENTH